MLGVFNEFNAIKLNISDILRASGYRNDYLAKKLGLTPSNFTVKKQRGSFTVEELQKIVEVITEPNEDAENAIMIKIMESRQNEPNIPISELKEEFGWK